MREGKGKKFAYAVLITVAVVIVLYMVQSVYFSNTGHIETEYALSAVKDEVLTVEGYAVRDECRMVNGENASVLHKNSDMVYVPVVSDSANVAVSDIIAVCFDNESQADAYLEIQVLKEKITDLEHLKSLEKLDRGNVVYLNSKIYSSVQAYTEFISDGDFTEVKTVVDDFSDNLTSKQIATGTKYDFDAIIKSYREQITSLQVGISEREYTQSPYAGYFVSEVDGFESTKSYDDVVNKKVAPLEAEKLLSSKSLNEENSYGKIIGQHTWYMIFDVEMKNESIVKTGKEVTVDFPERGIYDLPMTVYNVSDSVNGRVTVTLKCKYLNEQIAVLRKERLSITVDEYTGFRISSDALSQNEEGIYGVFVLSGNVARFTPINILYHGGDYVIAEKYIAYTKDKDGNKIVDEEKIYSYRELKAYDRIIVKGTNITDGKIIA